MPNYTVGRLRERQYQLTAQRHNEIFLKHNYYQQTARYFERESGIAKHYDSWNFKDQDSKAQVERAKKAERLLARKNKLRTLLKEEEEAYERELEEFIPKRNRKEEPTLEALRAKLREKKAEQSLYLPTACRRYQSYFVCPTESSRSSWNKSTDSQRSRVCRDSTNLLHRHGQHPTRRTSVMSVSETTTSRQDENVEARQEPEQPNPRYQARYSRRSLENTNVRTGDSEKTDYVPTRRSHGSATSLNAPYGKSASSNSVAAMSDHDKENNEGQRRPASREETSAAERRSASSGSNRSRNSAEYEEQRDGTPVRQYSGDVRYLERSPTVHWDAYRAESSSSEDAKTQRETDEADECSARNEQDRKDLKVSDNRQFESEKSLPWMRMIPNDKNLSKQMFLYLTHEELKCRIEDLAKRESHACIKQSWDEALRLRDMRNRLELAREKRLYNTEHLELDADMKKIGLANIDKREEELAEREFACTDSTMYSEEAKELWKKWVREDEGSVMKDARVQREGLMKTLEEHWQNLAIRDKERISQSFHHVIDDASYQEEHKAAVEMTAARKKSLTDTTE